MCIPRIESKVVSLVLRRIKAKRWINDTRAKGVNKVSKLLENVRDRRGRRTTEKRLGHYISMGWGLIREVLEVGDESE